MSNTPKDILLYEKIKKYIFLLNPINSAYRSGHLVKSYIKAYKEKYKNDNAYTGIKKEDIGLARWYKEKWTNQRGEIGYMNKGDIYRPSKRITIDTPKTYDELSKKQIINAVKIKKIKGRVNKF